MRPSFSQAAYGRTPHTAVLITMAPALRYVSGFVLPVEGGKKRRGNEMGDTRTKQQTGMAGLLLCRCAVSCRRTG